MRLTRCALLLPIALLAGLAWSDDRKEEVKEQALAAPHKVALKVRMEGPYTADVPLQVVCYFKYTPAGAKKMTGATPGRAGQTTRRVRSPLSASAAASSSGTRWRRCSSLRRKGAHPTRRHCSSSGWGTRTPLSLQLLEEVGRVMALREATRLGAHPAGWPTLAALHPRPGKLEVQDRRCSSRGQSAADMLLAYDTGEAAASERGTEQVSSPSRPVERRGGSGLLRRHRQGSAEGD